LGLRYGIPTVLTEHSGPFSVHMETKAQRKMVEEALAGVDRVLAVSPALTDFMKNYFPELHVQVLGNVVRTGFFEPSAVSGPPGQPLQFFSLALLCEGKGIQYLLQAARLLVERGVTNFDITIGGDGDYRPFLEARVRELGLQDRCRFLGLLRR